MKKLYILTIILCLAVRVNLQAQEQNVKEKVVREAIKETKTEIKAEKKDPKINKNEIKMEKKELRVERKALRKLEGSAVAPLAKTHFLADFGDIPNVDWKRSLHFDEATFVKDGQPVTAYYDFFSNLVGTSTAKSFGDLPPTAQKRIKSEYKEYTVGPIFFFEDNEANETEMVFFNTQFDDEDNYFVELDKGDKKIMLRVNSTGDTFFFKDL
jgi:hypothetical protein